jgi:ABC-type transporter MlaC component
MNSFDTIVQKPLDQSEASISLKSWRRVQYPNKICGAPISCIWAWWAHIFNLKGFGWIVLTQLSRNLSANQRPAFRSKSRRRDQYRNKISRAHIWATVFNFKWFGWVVLTQLSRILSANQRLAFQSKTRKHDHHLTWFLDPIFQPTFSVGNDSGH